MIINGKSVRGLFIYDPMISFEEGDFIIYDQNIYIVHPTEGSTYVIGETPSKTNKNYSLYPEGVGSYEEFLNWEEGTGSDKYISSVALYEILEKLCYGIDREGLLEEYDDLLNLDFNNGQVKIKRSAVVSVLPELYLGSAGTEFVIVRQTSFIDNNNKVKLQELLDPSTGYHYCRSIDENGIANWVTCIETDTTLIKKFEAIKNRYAENIRKATEISASHNRFKFFDLQPYFYVQGVFYTEEDNDHKYEISGGQAIGHGSFNYNGTEVSTSCIAVTFENGNIGFKHDARISDSDTIYMVTITIGTTPKLVENNTIPIIESIGSITINLLDGVSDLPDGSTDSRIYQINDIIRIKKSWSSTHKTINLTLEKKVDGAWDTEHRVEDYYFLDVYGRIYSFQEGS